MTEIVADSGALLSENPPVPEERNGGAMDMIRKKPCRIVCVTLVSLLLTTLIFLVNIIVDLMRDMMNNDDIWSALHKYIALKQNSTMCNATTIE